MSQPNAQPRRKDPADVICPALWQAKKKADKLASSTDPIADKQKFEELSKELDELGLVAGCRFVRSSMSHVDGAG